MGDGECDGEMTRGSPCGVESEDVCDWWDALCCGRGEAFMAPKRMFGLPFALTGPPFGIVPLAPAALITTEGFFPCSAWAAGVPFG